ncbi:MAG: dephospho-CoA kinase [Candidatus Omnitrophota bacterium]
MIIGITGSLATGKTSVARYLAYYLKAVLLDADEIAHQALEKGSPTYKYILSAFGSAILSKKALIDRKRLAESAFANSLNQKTLCGIIHPFAISKIESSIKDIYKKNNSSFIIIDAPLLIESGLYKQCDQLIVVVSSLVLQVERARNFKKIEPSDSLARIRLQMPLHKKIGYADHVIDNDLSLKELKQKCQRLARKLKVLRNRKKRRNTKQGRR